jgi:hypothetical protein
MALHFLEDNMQIPYLPEYKTRFFLSVFAFEKLGVVLNSRINKNTPAAKMFLRCIVHATTTPVSVREKLGSTLRSLCLSTITVRAGSVVTCLAVRLFTTVCE